MPGFFSVMKNATVTLPVIEIGALIVALSLCLVFRTSRTGLVIAYLFAYRWGWSFFLKQDKVFFTAYLVLGVVVGILTVLGMLQSRQEE